MRWFKQNKLPIQAIQTATGMILVQEDSIATRHNPVKATAIYARVSSHDQKKELDGQIARMSVYAAKNSFVVTHVLTVDFFLCKTLRQTLSQEQGFKSNEGHSV